MFPAISSTVIAFAAVDSMVAPWLLSTRRFCPPVLIRSPSPAPVMVPRFSTFVTTLFSSVTEGAVVAGEIMTLSLIVYVVSLEKICASEVDSSIVPALTINGVNTNNAGNIFPNDVVIEFN
ncbi:MAG: hypothetical protein ACRDD5_08275 [Silvania sp.]|uniref:Uncharacterized protein n=1 Tax=Silvania hatchlandensis TaxID=2926469 RepID=A0A9J6Q5L6_9ENTR|nr:hypothetical protein [Silvania hatchlandensis]MCU6664846.1 hypothetical protein [Silvania hatchlandensis]